MSRQYDRRLDKLEDNLLIGAERKRFEAEKRFYFNLPQVSSQAIQIYILASVFGFDRPTWVTAEFDNSIPHDAETSLVQKAEQLARESLHNSAMPDRQAKELTAYIESELPLWLEQLSWSTGLRIGSVEDVMQYCENAGRDNPVRSKGVAYVG